LIAWYTIIICSAKAFLTGFITHWALFICHIIIFTTTAYTRIIFKNRIWPTSQTLIRMWSITCLTITIALNTLFLLRVPIISSVTNTKAIIFIHINSTTNTLIWITSITGFTKRITNLAFNTCWIITSWTIAISRIQFH